MQRFASIYLVELLGCVAPNQRMRCAHARIHVSLPSVITQGTLDFNLWKVKSIINRH